ncbi:response regulator [Achromobacter denitrificans]
MKTVSAPRTEALPSPNPARADARALPGTRQHLLLSRQPSIVNVAILDDHPVIAVGVGAYLESQPGFRVPHQETSSRGLLEKLSHSPCHVALVDFYLPQEPWDGASLLRRLRRYHPNMAIITFSAGNRRETQYAAFRAGANGYLAKQWGMSLLPEMIQGVLDGQHKFLSVRDGKLHDQEPTAPHEALTASEVEILRHISQGFSVTQIAARLVRSKKTISTHKRCAMRKLQLADDLSLALYLREKFEQE